jgi:MerR family transcriptional regulator, aldehyde-responsive regulator
MYTIRQVAELTSFSPDTLRYYEKVGLVEPVRRGPGGVRIYSDDHLYLLRVLKCLKKTGLPLEDIKEFLQQGQLSERGKISQEGNEHPVVQRIKILSEHLARMEEQRQELDEIIYHTKQKLQIYSELLEQDSQITNP